MVRQVRLTAMIRGVYDTGGLQRFHPRVKAIMCERLQDLEIERSRDYSPCSILVLLLGFGPKSRIWGLNPRFVHFENPVGSYM